MYIMYININNLKIPKSYIEEGLTIQRSKEKRQDNSPQNTTLKTSEQSH
jgi:hypothetical protein